MTLTDPRLILTFEDTDITDSVQELDTRHFVRGSVRFSFRLLDGLKSSSDQVALQLVRDCPSIADIISTDKDVHAVLMDGQTTLFTGFLSTNHSWVLTEHGEQAFNVTLEGVGTRLLTRPFISTGHHLFDCTADAAIRAICAAVGITVSPSIPFLHYMVLKVVEPSESCRDILTQMLYELGYVYFFDNLGRLNLFKIDCTSVSGIRTLDGDDLVCASGRAVSLSKGIRQYDSARIVFSEIGRAVDYLVYRNITGQDGSHPYCNMEIPAGGHFDGTEIYTASEWSEELADEFREPAMIEACNAASETETVGSNDIIAVTNVTCSSEKQSGITCSITSAGGPYVCIDVHNGSNASARVTRLDAYGDIVFRRSDGVVRGGSGSNVLSEELSYVHERLHAQRHTNLLSDYNRFCSSRYTFILREDIALGTIVRLHDNVFSGLDVNVLLVSKEARDSSDNITYCAVGISVFNLDRELYHRTTDRPAVDLKGKDGADGTGISSIVYTYAVTSTQSTPSSVTSPTIPLLSSTDKYLWQKETITYSDGTTKVTTALIGVYGDTGSKGDTGAQGPQGEKGDTGSQGPKGDKGDTGSTGPQGPQGEKGETGLQGPKGDKGNTGDTGPQGPQGEKGETGSQGPKGDTGSTGPQGDKGEKGDTGATGPQGPQGSKGDKGDTGNGISSITYYYAKTTTQNAPSSVTSTTIPALSATEKYLWQKEVIAYTDGTSKTTTALIGVYGDTGSKGDKGDKGNTGDTGPQGPQGEKGDTGSQGPKGDKGDTGATGPQGPQGNKGDKGDKGDTGSQGPKGDTGATGPQGPQGGKGDKGDKGDTGSQGPQGPQGPRGKTGTTVSIQYAMKYIGQTPVNADFSDERPDGWTVGCVYWQRFKYVDGDGNTTYSSPEEDGIYNDVMEGQVSFGISASVQSYERDLRSSDTVAVTLQAFSYRYLDPSFSWTVNGTAYTGNTVSLSWTKKAAPDGLAVSCTLTSIVNGNTYTDSRNLSVTAVDVTRYNINQGILSADPTGDFVEGDSYVRHTGDDYLPYVYTNGSWTQITDVSNWPVQIAQIRDAVLAGGVNVPSTSVALFGYFRNLSAQDAQIDAISSKEIVLQSGGSIRSSDYNEDAQGNPLSGFRIDAAGSSTFVNANVVNSNVSGSFTSNPLETQDAQPSSQITGSFSEKVYSDRDTYAVIADHVVADQLSAVSGTYGSTQFSKILRLENDTQRTSRKTLASRSGITGTSSLAGTMGVNGSVLMSLQRYRRSITRIIYSGAREASCYYRIGSGTRQAISADSATAALAAGQTLTMEHEYDVSGESLTVGAYDNLVSFTSFFPSGKTPDKSDNSRPKKCFLEVNGKLFFTSLSYIYKGTGGSDWQKIAVTTDTSDTTSDYRYVRSVITDGVSVLLAIGPHRIYKSDLNGESWTLVLSKERDGVQGFHDESAVCYGGGEFRVAGSGNTGTYYSSTDGVHWTTRNFNTAGYVWGLCYGNNTWLSSLDVPDFNVYHDSITFCNGRFFHLYCGNESNKRVELYTSTNGSSWSRVHVFASEAWAYSSSAVAYGNGYYYVGINLNTNTPGTGTGGGIYSSPDGVTWTRINDSNWISFIKATYIQGRMFLTASKGVDFGTFTSSDWVTERTGSLLMQYDHASYPIGANLLDASSNIVRTVPNAQSWHDGRIAIPSLSYTEQVFRTFLGFTSNNASVSSFDARMYVSGATFRLSGTSWSGVSVNITSPTSGLYSYNLKWNGTVLQIILNGTTLYTFTQGEHFVDGASFLFTPMGQLDAILVKDVLPKADSQYDLGAQGNEFANAYINNIYGNLTGNVSGNVTGNVSGNSGSSDRINSPDTRNTNPAPNTVSKGLTLDFKANSAIGISGHGSYCGLLTFRPYGSTTDFSGGPVHRIAFCEDGAIMHQTGNASGWGSWSYPSTWN